MNISILTLDHSDNITDVAQNKLFNQVSSPYFWIAFVVQLGQSSTLYCVLVCLFHFFPFPCLPHSFPSSPIFLTFPFLSSSFLPPLPSLSLSLSLSPPLSLKSLDYRIYFLNMYHHQARAVLCAVSQAHKSLTALHCAHPPLHPKGKRIVDRMEVERERERERGREVHE